MRAFLNAISSRPDEVNPNRCVEILVEKFGVEPTAAVSLTDVWFEHGSTISTESFAKALSLTEQVELSLLPMDQEKVIEAVLGGDQLPEAEQGFLSALGWVSSQDLQGTVRALLGSKEAIHRAWALAACAMHRVDPGPVLTQAVRDADPVVRARAWRVAEQLGRRDLADAARLAISRQAAPVHDEHATVVVGPSGQANYKDVK